MLDVDSVCVSFGSRAILKKVSFSLERGQVLGIIGPNGSGKTTLIRTLSGVLRPLCGQVRVAGKILHQLKPPDRARLVAVVPQARSLPGSFTGWETVLLGRTPYLNWLGQVSPRDEDLARQVMQRTRTAEFAERRVADLSGGEQQRLLLARALVQGAPLLLLDEPTTHLDLQYQIDLLEQVRGLARQEGLTVIITLHDLNLVAHYADQVALLVAGQIEALGSPREVLEADRLSRAYHLPLRVIDATISGSPLILPANL